MRWRNVSLLALSLVALLAACGTDDPTATPRPTAAADATPTPTATAGPVGFEADWAALIAAAQEEGKMVPVIGGGNGHEMQAVYDHFGELFDIRMIYSRGSSTQQADRIFAEQAAGRYLVDTAHSGDTTMTRRYVPNGALRNFDELLIHPEVIDKSLWLQGKHWYQDVEESYSLVFSGEFAEEDAAPGVMFNTNLVSIEEATKWTNMFEVLAYAKANWAGKIVAGNPLEAGGGFSGNLARDYLNPALGPEWLAAIYGDASLDLFFTDDEPTRCNGVATGKFAMGIVIGTCDDHIRAGAPIIRVDTAFREEYGIAPYAELGDVEACIACAIAVFVETPNFNASKLFVNWLLSREGQTVYHEKVGLGTAAGREEENHGQHTLRIDNIPLGNVDPALAPDPNKDYLGLQMQPIYFELLEPVGDWVRATANSAYFQKTGEFPPPPFDAAELRTQIGIK
jgi:ABC-type Fe3+ transport system substrate-binding protein